MDLYIVRHGLAGEHGDPRYPDDGLRPLTDEGKKLFRKTAKRLVKAGVAPLLVATSPLARCRQTAELLAKAIKKTGEEVELLEVDALQPQGGLRAVLEWTRKNATGDVAWVGHAPDVDQYASALIGAPPDSLRFAKGAAAAIRFAGPLEPGAGRLLWFVREKVYGL